MSDEARAVLAPFFTVYRDHDAEHWGYHLMDSKYDWGLHPTEDDAWGFASLVYLGTPELVMAEPYPADVWEPVHKMIWTTELAIPCACEAGGDHAPDATVMSISLGSQVEQPRVRPAGIEE